MILNITTRDFDDLDIRGLKKAFSQYLGNKVNEIVSGSMTNSKWGLFVVRHDGCAYSKIKVDPTDSGLAELSIYNYSTKEWQAKP